MVNDNMSRPHRSMSATDLSAIFDEVQTERLVLRRPRIEDGPAMFAVHGDPATNRYNPAGTDADLATSEEALREWRQHWEDNGFGYWAVMLSNTTKVVGFGGVMHVLWPKRDVLNLYYRLTPGVWGQGYATELARTAVTLARTYLPQWPVVARIRPANIPSIRTAERAGLQRRPDLDTENMDTEHIIFALGWFPTEAP